MRNSILSAITFIASTKAIKTSSIELDGGQQGDIDTSIVYPDGREDEIRISPHRYPASFGWQSAGGFCSATMVSPRMALTAAHCVTEAWDTDNLPSNARVKLTGREEGQFEWFNIQEIRVNDCWNFDDIWSTINNDLAIIILDRDRPNAELGVEYIEPWFGSQSDLVGQTFELTGWGLSGEESQTSYNQINIFHRGYNVVNQFNRNVLEYTFNDPDTDGGLYLESTANSGDSGGGALFEDASGKYWHVGTKSYGYPATYCPYAYCQNGYIYTGGWQKQWLQANLANLDQRMPVEQGSCNGNVNGDDWVNPDEPDDEESDNGGDITDDGNENGDDDNEGGDSGNEGGDDGNESDNGDDDGSSNEVVEALIQDAQQAASEAGNILEGAQSRLESIRTKYADFNQEYEKAAEADQKVYGAMAASEEYLIQAEDAIYGPADEGTMVMEEGCSATGKITGFNKMIEAEIRTVNAEAKVINVAKKEAGKDKKQLIKDAAKIATPQASCEAELDVIISALNTLLDDYPDQQSAITELREIRLIAQADCDELLMFGTAEEIKQDSNEKMIVIDDMRKFAQQAKKDIKVIRKEINKLKKPAELVDFNRWADEFQIPVDAGECRVQATRQDFFYTPITDEGQEPAIHTHDFQVFYLIGDCTADDEMKVKFSRGSWRNIPIYDGEKTNLTTETDKVREFTLTQGSLAGGDRAAFRLSKKVRVFKARSPRGIVIVDDNAPQQT